MSDSAGHRHLILATAGHIDHGKSSLVRALTGTDPDRLPEEKRRGITIDLGFAAMQVGDVHVGIVDVPGHEDFVANMVAGVGSIDAALLVVAADDGWMPQTEEHLQILTYLGVRHGLTALTKADLVEDETAGISAVRERLRGTFLHGSPIVPTAARSGRGIEALRAAIASVLAATPPPRDIGKPRLGIDRVFSLRGVGTVVTGTLAGGSLRRGQAVQVYPCGRPAHIRSMQNHNQDVEVASPGSRVALNLPDADAPTAGRGKVVSLPGVVAANPIIDVQLWRWTREPGSAVVALRTGGRVRVHHGSSAVAARVRLLETAALGAGATSLARLTLELPAALAAGDRLVLRDASEQHTLAGAVVLDAEPGDPRRRQPHNLAALRERAAAMDDPAVFITTQVRLQGVMHRDQIPTATRFSAGQTAAGIDASLAAENIVAAGELLLEPLRWRQLLESAERAVDALHRAHPDWPGLPVAELATLAKSVLPGVSGSLAPALASAVAAAMEARGFLRVATTIRRASHRISLPPRLEPAARVIRAQLDERPFEPPSRKVLGHGDLAQQALRFMIASGAVVEVSVDVVLSAEAYAAARERIAQHLQARGPASVSQLKDLLGSSRRIMVPLLEKLDRERFTRREGDLRVLSDAFPNPAGG
jgi:selenocysteine-specific elongation factor